jgi:hypothetical protein
LRLFVLDVLRATEKRQTLVSNQPPPDNLR